MMNSFLSADESSLRDICIIAVFFRDLLQATIDKLKATGVESIYNQSKQCNPVVYGFPVLEFIPAPSKQKDLLIGNFLGITA